MRAGRLRQRIDLQRQTGVADDWGDVVEAWTTFAANVPATVNPLLAKQAFNNGVVSTDTTHRIYIRYSSDVAALTTRDRIKFGDIYLDITSVANIDTRGVMYEIVAVERA